MIYETVFILPLELPAFGQNACSKLALSDLLPTNTCAQGPWNEIWWKAVFLLNFLQYWGKMVHVVIDRYFLNDWMNNRNPSNKFSLSSLQLCEHSLLYIHVLILLSSYALECIFLHYSSKLQLFSNLRGYCTPGQFLDCFCIFLKNCNTLVTSKICFV